MRSTRASLAALAAASLAGCAGIFQLDRPDVPMRYAVAASGPLSVGSAERDVTPDVGGYLAGFDPSRESTYAAHPLKVRALVLATPTRRFAIVGIDNLGLMREDTDWIKAGIAGFANGDVLLCASHTHAGPDLIGLWGELFLVSGRDREHLAALRAATAAAVAEAAARAAPAQLVHGRALLPAEGLVKNANRPGVFDRRLSVLHATARDDGRPLGTLLHFACHPEVMPRRSTAISSDFAGELCDLWRAHGRGQALFVNGALGAMISPAVEPRDEIGVRAFAGRACAVAEQALQAATQLPVDAIEVRREDVYLPMASAAFLLGRLTTTLPRALHGGDARSTVGWLRIGTFEAILVPGELEPVFAQQIRARCGRPDLHVFGLCDDEVGYLLRLQDARDPLFAYERTMSPCLTAGERVRDALLGVHRGVNGYGSKSTTAQ